MSEESINSSESGYFQPPRKPYRPLPNFEEQLNRTRPVFSIQILDGIHNLIDMLPTHYALQLEIGGEPVVWLRRKTEGTPCPNIQKVGGDTYEEQCPVSKCPLCYDTTFLGGYDLAILLKMSFNPQQVQINMEQAGLVIAETPTAWTIDTDPIMKEFDMIVTYANERYLVATQESETKQGQRVYQRLTLTKPDKYDVVYEVPVPGIMGNKYHDFRSKVIIRGHHKDFLSMVEIYNYYWFPDTGLTNEPLGGLTNEPHNY